jgi:CRP-like cAMP-binding protein
MASCTVPASLQLALADGCERICKAKSTVLFRRGEKAHGMFIVFSGNVSLDFGVDTPLARSCGPGALVGLPSTITGCNYSMTAIVTQDAELGFWTPEALESLLRDRPELCHQLLTILGEKTIELQNALKEAVNPPQRSQVV